MEFTNFLTTLFTLLEITEEIIFWGLRDLGTPILFKIEVPLFLERVVRRRLGVLKSPLNQLFLAMGSLFFKKR
jgi:hypothetical protein